MDFKIIPQVKELKSIGENAYDFSAVRFKNSPLSEAAEQDFLSFHKFKESEKENIIFTPQEDLPQEGYRLSAAGGVINIFYSHGAGAFYALQTLKQLLHQSNFNLPEIEITDSPAYEYRGAMLDVGRYFYSVDDVKKFIDRMALHKLNRFHFHLTEDQGWRVEIDRYPLLTQIGSRRSHTNFNNIPHGGFYTKAQIREIVDYCHAKYIKVMPEFDVPGHSRAAIAAYSELACFPRELPVATHWGVKKDVLCAGRESSYEFVFNVIDELCELFPDGLFHMGGDEVPKHRWRLCPECQKKIKEQNLKNEDELQEYFMNRVYDHLAAKGYQVFMWNYEDISPRILNENIGFTLCNGKHFGRPCIDTRGNTYYYDLPFGYISLADVCKNGVCDGAIGAEAQIWTEYIPNLKKADMLANPRLAAMCENVWCGKCEEQELYAKLGAYESMLDKLGIAYTPNMNKLNPNPVRKKLSGLWFEKRQLDWEGLTILIDDKKVENAAKK